MSRPARYTGRPPDAVLRLGCASLKGAEHEKDGTPNQDSVLVRTVWTGTSGDVAIIAVSDGAGSAPVAPTRDPGPPAPRP